MALLGLAAVKIPILADPSFQANIVGSLMPFILAGVVYITPNKVKAIPPAPPQPPEVVQPVIASK